MRQFIGLSQVWQHLMPEKVVRQRLYRLMPGALIPMLLVGAAFHPAQAGPSTQIDDPNWESPRYTLFTDFEEKPDPICPGDEVWIITYVYVSDIPPSQRSQQQEPDAAGYNRAGVKITVSGAAYGTISPPSAVTLMTDTGLAITPIARFKYTADKPGSEQLIFEAGSPAPAGTQRTLEFEVENCTHEVAMIYRGVLNISPLLANYSGVLDPTKLDQSGENQHSGVAPFELAETFHIPGAPCSVVGSISSSQADIVAASQEQTTNFTITFQPNTQTVNVHCPDAAASAAGMWGAQNLGPVEVTTPTAGGVARFSESHTGYHGVYTVIVERVVDESQAAIPGTVLLAARP